jgi:hypothetical protein
VASDFRESRLGRDSFFPRPRLHGRAASESPARHSSSGGGKNPSSRHATFAMATAADICLFHSPLLALLNSFRIHIGYLTILFINARLLHDCPNPIRIFARGHFSARGPRTHSHLHPPASLPFRPHNSFTFSAFRTHQKTAYLIENTGQRPASNSFGFNKLRIAHAYISRKSSVHIKLQIGYRGIRHFAPISSDRTRR